MQGLATLSGPGLKYRLDKAVPFLKALLEQPLAERSASVHLRWPGRMDPERFPCAWKSGNTWLVALRSRLTRSNDPLYRGLP